MVAIEEAVGEGLAAGDDVAQRVEEASLIVACRIEVGALGKPGGGDIEDFARKVVDGAATGHGCVQRLSRNRMAQRLALLDRPMLDAVPGGLERGSGIEQADP